MTIPDVGEYRDRTTGLIVFGILEILFGFFCWLFVPLLLLSMAFASRRGGAPVPPFGIAPAVAVYSLGGTVLIWLGIGSVLGRRWARALWVCVSGVGLAAGVLAIPFGVYATVVNLPQTMAASARGRTLSTPLVQLIVLGFLVLFYVLIPGTLFLFYRSPHVKRTCEAKDPKERWTDRCPLPVLALSLFTALGGGMVLMILPFFDKFPVFGLIARGATGTALMVAYAATMLYVAWGLYRLRIGAWGLFLVVLTLVTLSGIMTVWHYDMRELYMKMGFEPGMAARAGELAQGMKWMNLIWFLPWLGWVLYVRRYFAKAPRTETAV
jgi:uncharacterized membrane protein